MPGSDEAIGADDREAHRVLEPVADALRLVGAARHPEQAGVGGDVERVIGGIHAHAMDVLGTRLSGRLLERVVFTASGEGRRDHDQQAEQGVETPP